MEKHHEKHAAACGSYRAWSLVIARQKAGEIAWSVFHAAKSLDVAKSFIECLKSPEPA